MRRIQIDPVLKYVQMTLLAENAYLLPMRFFIGIGWIRAGLEKLIEPGWLNGSELTSFLNTQLSGNMVVFPFYRHWIESTFLPGALTLSWAISAGQLLVGLAVLSGTLTNFALWWGLFMNLNFILAGQVTPSAFYVVIQIILLLGNAGAVMGFDQMLRRRIRARFLVAQSETSARWARFERRLILVLGLLSLVGGVMAIPFIRDFSPHSVDDPAMILLVLSVFTSLSAMITYLRLPDSADVKVKDAEAREATRPRHRHMTVK